MLNHIIRYKYIQTFILIIVSQAQESNSRNHESIANHVICRILFHLVFIYKIR